MKKILGCFAICLFTLACSRGNKEFGLVDTQDYQNYLSEGISAVHRGDYKYAISRLNVSKQTLKGNDKIALRTIYFYRGVAFSNLFKHRESIKEYNLALKVDPDFIDAKVNRHWQYITLNDWDNAMKDIEDLKKSGSNVEFLKENEIYVKNMIEEQKRSSY
jgi:tetratricopeptide (TPR) repeat protein